MKYFLYILKLMIILTPGPFFSCNPEDELEVKFIRDFDIYANDTLNNVLVFDMVPTSRGFLLASICGTSRLANKFGGDGRLFLLEVDNLGNVLWEDICQTRLFQSGYPSNLIKTTDPDQFYLLWNEFNGNLKSIPLSTGMTPDSLAIKKASCKGCRADRAFLSEDKIYALGLSEGNSGPRTVITEFDLELESSRLMTEKPFNASPFGGFGLNDLNFINRINNFIHLKPSGLRLLFAGPSKSQMILSHIGEIIPEYSNNNLWIADIIINPGSKESFALVFQDPDNPQGQSIFIPWTDLSGLPGESNLSSRVSESKYQFGSLDPDLPQFIINYDATNWAVIGNSLSGLPTIISINTETGRIVRSELGDITRLDIAKAELRGNDLYISGTTVVNNRFQRPFLLRVSKTDIF